MLREPVAFEFVVVGLRRRWSSTMDGGLEQDKRSVTTDKAASRLAKDASISQAYFGSGSGLRCSILHALFGSGSGLRRGILHALFEPESCSL